MPTGTVYAQLDTITSGRGELLTRGGVTAHLHMAGVEIGGWLDDLQLMVDAAQEELARAREYAKRLGAREETTGHYAGRLFGPEDAS